MTRRHQAEAGFTLIEVLIGVTLLAMFATLVATGTRAAGQAWNSAERRTGEVDDMDTVQTLLRRTLAEARPSFAVADPADPTIAFSGEPDTLSLVAPQPGTQGDGPWARERLFVGSRGGRRAMFISWQLAAPATDDRLAPVGEVMLLGHVTALRFAYFGSLAPGEPAAWLDQWMARDRLPELVRVAIVRNGKGLRAWPELVVATRITGNAGCVYNALNLTCQRAR